MWEGVLAFLLFFSFIFAFPKLFTSARDAEDDPDLIEAKIRLARWRAGENPWPELPKKEEKNDD